MDKQDNDARQEPLRAFEERMTALDKQCAALAEQMRRQTEALAAASKIKQSLAAGAMATTSLTSRWNSPYSFAHYLIQESEERTKKAVSTLDDLVAAIKALAGTPLPPAPETAQQTPKPCRTAEQFKAEGEALMLASLMYPPPYMMRTGHDWGDDWNGLPEEYKAKLPKGWSTSGYGVARYLAACRVQQLLRDMDASQNQTKQVSS